MPLEPARRDEGLTQSRQPLVDAAIDLVGEGGWEALNPQALASRAGISLQTFYDVFEGPENCFMAAFEYSIQSLSRAIDARPGNPVPKARPADRRIAELRIVLAVALVFLDRNPAIARLLFVEALRAGDRVLQRRREVFLLLVLDIADALDPLAPDGCAVTQLTWECVLLGAVGVIHEKLLDNPAYRLTNLLDPLTNMALLVHHPPKFPPSRTDEQSLDAA